MNNAYTPNWKKANKQAQTNYECTAKERLIKATFQNIDHYNEMYRKFHHLMPCAGCGTIPRLGTAFSKHSPDARSVSLYL